MFLKWGFRVFSSVSSHRVEKLMLKKKSILFLGLLSLLSYHPVLTELLLELADCRLRVGSARRERPRAQTHRRVCKCSLPPNVTKIALKNSDLVVKERPSQIHF